MEYEYLTKDEWTLYLFSLNQEDYDYLYRMWIDKHATLSFSQYYQLMFRGVIEQYKEVVEKKFLIFRWKRNKISYRLTRLGQKLSCLEAKFRPIIDLMDVSREECYIKFNVRFNVIGHVE